MTIVEHNDERLLPSFRNINLNPLEMPIVEMDL
jgi:hypothetical protein